MHIVFSRQSQLILNINFETIVFLVSVGIGLCFFGRISFSILSPITFLLFLVFLLFLRLLRFWLSLAKNLLGKFCHLCHFFIELSHGENRLLQ